MATVSVSHDAIITHFDSPTYKLEQKIGEGGFGSVYRAKHVNTGQIVAIKFLSLKTDFAEDKKKRYIERFERETQLCSRLQHPNIVRLLDKGCCNNNLLYAVFEYIDGKTLKETISDLGYLSAVETADIMSQVLDALAHAHEMGVIHRDVKPANIMLSRTGVKTHVKVLDFGIGTLVDEARQLDYKSITLSQETLGTPSYSAPEQLRGEPPTVKTDIYVWGLVFIECLTGKPAVSGGNLASVFHKQLSQSNVPIPAAIAAHPVSSILRRALHKKTHERTVTASELFAELKQMNFSNLVGDLANDFGSEQSDSIDDFDSDFTQINENIHTSTGLTERKQLTAMAVCLKVRKVSQDDQDADIIDTLHHDQKNLCVDTAIRYGAYHVGTLGDTMLFYFGYPTVSDNDTRLCARAALDMMSDMSKRNSLLRHSQKVHSEIRVGIHTGLVTTYADTTPEGDTPNTALELSRLAMADQVLCSDSTRKTLDAYIEFEPRETQTIGVNAQNIPTWSLIGERQVEAFGFLRSTRRNLAFIGRESELRQLTGILCRRHSSEANLSHVYGEAGIGKSRLVFELRERAKSYQHLVTQCLPEHKNNALYPVLNLLRYKYTLDTLPPDQAAEVLIKAVSNISEINSASALPILFTWLNLPLVDEMEPSALAPDAQRELLFTLLAAMLLDKSNSLKDHHLLIFEDIHWADPTSLEFLTSLGIKLKDCDDSLVCTSRKPLPENMALIGFDSVKVDKLQKESTRAFICNLFNDEPVSEQVQDILEQRTDGIPLFIEELVDMLNQKGLVDKLNGVYNFISPDKLDEVPETLRDSLHQKLDSLIYSKETAQLAAAIGREFDYLLLVASSDRTESQIQNDLNELVSMDLVLQQRRVDGDSYIFKHALVRDAAYDSITGTGKTNYHHRIALAYENEFPDVSETQPWLVANHYYLSGKEKAAKAVTWGTKHIKGLAKLSLNMEAVESYAQIQDWISTHNYQGRSADRLILILNSTIIPSYTKKYGWGYEKLKELANENLSILERIADEGSSEISQDELVELRYKSEWVLFAFCHYQGNRREARQRGEAIFNSDISQNNRVNRIMLATMLGQAYFFDGDFDKASVLLKEVMELYDPEKDTDLNVDFGFDPYLMAAGNQMSIDVMTGDLISGKKYRDLCLEYALKTDNKASIITGYTWGTCYYFLLNDRKGMKEWCAYARQTNPEVFEGEWIQRYFDSNEGWYSAEVDNGLRVIEEDISSGQTGILAWYEPPVADSLLRLGRYSESRKIMHDSYTRSVDSGDICVVAITLRELGRAEYADSGNLSDALEYFNLSLEYAERTGSQYLEVVTICNILDEISGLDCNYVIGLRTRLRELSDVIKLSDGNIWLEKSKQIMES
ncbi:TOMM system kinase/cyclase fusion protein [Oceanospirillum sediminis]|uniref:TOMM system kinase/cyclase fusion protein n=1 Tax=Oceanospirillum sediminis TaxID=2760088 RepID=A0A839IQ73_9GAMM|nr:TOMM system kinase/cyclase fusion protein [Oceanospirillum sediminis]MBB1486376.1 TOMM system kinase/cyclase fusion protein [Oceanospirillum sediminis]